MNDTDKALVERLRQAHDRLNTLVTPEGTKTDYERESDEQFALDACWSGADRLEALSAENGRLNLIADEKDELDGELEALSARVAELEALLEQVRQRCLFDEDDGQIGVTEDPHIEMALFAEICTALKDTQS